MNKTIFSTRAALPAGVLLLLFMTAPVKAQPAGGEGMRLTSYVNPFIGTREMGHTFPGAVAPFGMVQLSPDTDTVPYAVNGTYNGEVYRYCAGYQYNDKTIVGFSHTHFSGTGHSDLGDFLLMATTGPVKLNPGTAENPGSGYRSRFSHASEKAEPGYYSVNLDDYGIRAELTATSRVGFHRYTFPETAEANIILDMNHGIYNYDGKVLWSYARVENDTLVTGYRITRGWARTSYLYFAMSFSRPIESYGFRDMKPVVYKGFWRKFDQENNFPEMAGEDVRAWFRFSTSADDEVKIKFALSAVSTEGALKNLVAEAPNWDFDAVRAETSNRWERELGRIRITAPEERMINFYTSLYHAFISPVEYMDVDGRYRGIDHNIHMADGFTNHTVFSLWDTYRALHPLFTLVQPERTSDMVNSMLAHYDQSVHKVLPVWSHFGNENWCMIGYHAVSVIADAWVKGIRGFDKGKAMEACLNSSAYKPYDGLGSYMEKGYVPFDVNRYGASITLEYGYDDWAIARFAESVGNTAVASEYYARSAGYRKLFDGRSGFIRPMMSNGEWKEPFDPLHTSGEGFIEGNAWNYSMYVPFDIAGLVELKGGEKRFGEYLDSLFTMELPDRYFADTEDITREGILGSYVHGNEPGHHIPYMYNHIGMPWKTQSQVHRIVNEMYRNEPDGLCGNDDCGQMSAWYIFSCLGFYPVAPGIDQYVIGSPCVSSATIPLSEGKSFTVRAEGLSDRNIYIQRATLNGKPLERTWITHSEIVAGGELVFVMGPRPSRSWGVKETARPYSMSLSGR
ncbi:MAG: GH92 family glycosyl hydrolase [Bacteroidales bacterium]|nr:GH92 family glycosyl hydrolase [Bacteroidales bacterium]